MFDSIIVLLVSMGVVLAFVWYIRRRKLHIIHKWSRNYDTLLELLHDLDKVEMTYENLKQKTFAIDALCTASRTASEAIENEIMPLIRNESRKPHAFVLLAVAGLLNKSAAFHKELGEYLNKRAKFLDEVLIKLRTI